MAVKTTSIPVRIRFASGGGRVIIAVSSEKIKVYLCACGRAFFVPAGRFSSAAAVWDCSSRYHFPVGRHTVFCGGDGMDRILRMRRRWRELQLPVFAANAAFFLSLSLFPILGLLLGLIGRLSLSRTEFFSVFSQLVPTVLRPLFLEAIRTAGRGAAMSVSALAGLWSASRGIYSLLQGLCRVSGDPAPFRPLLLRLLSVVYTAVFLLALLVTFALHNLGHTLLHLLRNSDSGVAASLEFVLHQRGGVCFLFLSGLFVLVYRAYPPGSARNLRQVLPGSFLAAGGWVLFSALFTLWSGTVTDYSQIYGSVAVMAMTMLWLYACLLIILFGALLNRMAQDIDKAPPS